MGRPGRMRASERGVTHGDARPALTDVRYQRGRARTGIPVALSWLGHVTMPLKGCYRPMRGFKQLHTAQVVCAGHGFMRALHDGFYRLGFVLHGPDRPHRPRLQTAWEELTTILRVA